MASLPRRVGRRGGGAQAQRGRRALQQGVDEEQVDPVGVLGGDPVRGERVEVRSVARTEQVHGVPEPQAQPARSTWSHSSPGWTRTMSPWEPCGTCTRRPACRGPPRRPASTSSRRRTSAPWRRPGRPRPGPGRLAQQFRDGRTVDTGEREQHRERGLALPGLQPGEVGGRQPAARAAASRVRAALRRRDRSCGATTDTASAAASGAGGPVSWEVMAPIQPELCPTGNFLAREAKSEPGDPPTAATASAASGWPPPVSPGSCRSPTSVRRRCARRPSPP